MTKGLQCADKRFIEQRKHTQKQQFLNTAISIDNHPWFGRTVLVLVVGVSKELCCGHPGSIWTLVRCLLQVPQCVSSSLESVWTLLLLSPLHHFLLRTILVLVLCWLVLVLAVVVWLVVSLQLPQVHRWCPSLLPLEFLDRKLNTS